MTAAARGRVLGLLQQLYDAEETTHEEKVEIGLVVRTWAEEETPDNRCLLCKHGVCYIPDAQPRFEGHIYSEIGAAEFRISRYCEWCFDEITKDEEEEEGYDGGT